jgi:hypothetical protein
MQRSLQHLSITKRENCLYIYNASNTKFVQTGNFEEFTKIFVQVVYIKT